MRFGLMIIDLQKAYYEGDSKKSMDSVSEYINAIIPLFRKKKLPIIWIQDIDDEDGVVPGTEGFDLIECLKPEKNDYRIHKKYGNGFNKTKLVDILKEENIQTLIVTGYSAEYCVLSTYRGALDYDLTPVLLKNGIASENQTNIKFVEDISDTISYNILKKLLE
jgi:nicotinamidase-related amidase